jgi:hypothetical protein
VFLAKNGIVLDPDDDAAYAFVVAAAGSAAARATRPCGLKLLALRARKA